LFIIAKVFGRAGCLVTELKDNNQLGDVVNYLEERIQSDKIQIVTLTNPDAYGEYQPYFAIETVDAFIDFVLDVDNELNER
jgi:hypothetical protein